MPIRFDQYDDAIKDAGAAQAAKLELDPPYNEQWPGWVLRTRRKRWTAVPVLELCALFICLATLMSLSSTDSLPLSDVDSESPLYAPAGH